MPNIRNWEDWDEIEERSEEEISRQKVKNGSDKKTGSDRGWKGPQKTLSPNYRKEKSKK
jgi:hypothetical protein